MMGDQITRLNYIKWQPLYTKEKPFQVFSNVSEDTGLQQTTNLVFQTGEPETVHDARGIERTFQLDTEGFTFVTHRTNVGDFKDTYEIETRYFQEMEHLLRQHVEDIDRVYFFDWRVI